MTLTHVIIPQRLSVLLLFRQYALRDAQYASRNLTRLKASKSDRTAMGGG